MDVYGQYGLAISISNPCLEHVEEKDRKGKLSFAGIQSKSCTRSMETKYT